MAEPNDTITPLTPPEAFKLMQDNPNSMLVDVRTDIEFLMIGHPKGAVHVPWIEAPDWVINPDFVKEVKRLVLVHAEEGPGDGDDVLIILICRSGIRSDDAAHALQLEGLKNLYAVKSGFEGPLDENHQRSTIAGWRFDGLPWEQT